MIPKDCEKHDQKSQFLHAHKSTTDCDTPFRLNWLSTAVNLQTYLSN